MPGKKKTSSKKAATSKAPGSRKSRKPSTGNPKGKASAADGRNEDLRKMLLKKQKDVINNTQEEVAKYITGESRQIVESALDGGDWSVIDLSEDLRIQRLGANQDTLITIDEAIRKLDEGSYGKCDDCGDKISSERLKILPFAIRCRDCQEDREELEAAEKGESIVF